MADPIVPPIVKRNYGARLTLDLDTSLPDVKPEGCLSLKNVIRRGRKGLAKRPGTKMVISNEYSGDQFTPVHCGLLEHVYEDDAQGVDSDLFTMIRTSSSLILVKLATNTIAVNYVGAGTNPSVSILANAAGSWEVTLTVNGATVSGWPKTYAAKTGRISTLVSNIDGEADWTATDASTLKAYASVAQIGSLPQTALVAAATPDLTITYSGSGTEASYPNLSTDGPPAVDQLNFENMKGVNAQNCAYIPLQKRTSVLKYDGNRAYKPGLPRAQIHGIADAGSGTAHAAGAVLIYRIGFWRVDAKENQIYGPYSDDTLAVATHTVGGAPTDVNVTFRTLEINSLPSLNANYGNSGQFAPRSAIVNGTQAGVTTVTVDAGHALQVGDSVYFYDGITSAYVTKLLTAVAATTITFSGAVNVLDNAVMSNIRVQIQRTEDDGIDFFEVANIPMIATTGVTTQVFLDNVADASLGASIEEQIKLPEPPPNANFCCIHQGLIIYACLEDDAVGFVWNDPAWGLEAYPVATNRDRVLGGEPGPITGVVSENDTSLLIFKARSVFRVEGDLAAGQYIIVEVSGRLGIASHASIVKMESEIFGISEEGPVVISGGQIQLLPFADGVSSFFSGLQYKVPAAENVEIDAADETKLVPRRSTGVYWKEQGAILFFVPAEEGETQGLAGASTIARYANENSLWLCWDVNNKEWREWEFEDSGINAHLAMISHKGEIFFQSTNEHTPAIPVTTPKNFVWKFLSDDSVYSYADNTDPIEWAPRLQWEALGLPSSEKKMTEIKLYMRHAQDFLASFDLDVREYQNGDDVTLYTQASRTFSASTDREKIIEAIPGSFESNSIEFYNNELYQCPVLSGFEVAYRVTAAPEIKDTKGDT